MNRKKLPKAIRPASAEMHVAPIPSDANEPQLVFAAESVTLDAPESSRRNGSSNVIELTAVTEPSSVSSGQAARVAALPIVQSGTSPRRARALAIVNRHAIYSALGGIPPLPLANFAGITAIIVRMVKVLSHHYGVPFERDRARAIVIGLVGGAMPTGVAAVTTSTLFTVLPPTALLGMAVCSVTAAAFTRGIGRIFVEHFESGATFDDFPLPERG